MRTSLRSTASTTIPYYNDFVTRLGFEKECDWVQYRMVADHGVPDKTRRVAKIVQERYNLHFGSIDRLKKDPRTDPEVLQDVQRQLRGRGLQLLIPFTDEEIEEEAKSVMPFISDKASCLLMDENDNLVAFGISFPSISKALQKARGHLFPFGWIHLLRALNNYETTDLMLNGAVPEWQHKGVSAVYYLEMADKSKR